MMQYDHHYLMAKQQHRRRRQLEKLKTTKRRKYQSNYVYEWHSNKHKKYKQAEWRINIHFEYETKLIFSNTDYDEYEIEQQHQITVGMIENEQEKDKESNKNKKNLQKMSLSSCFEAIENDFHNQKPKQFEFPSAVTSYITSLYAHSDITDHVNGLLKSVRFWNIDKQPINGQATVIGPFLEELIEIFAEDDVSLFCSMDVIYLILELVGDAILWLRQPGLNIFKWSTNSTIRTNDAKHSIVPQTQFRDCYAFREDEFYFSGYIENEKMRQLLNDDSVAHDQNYQDLDWLFVVFLLLGLVPNTQSSYYRWYFNQKLMSALPGYIPFGALLK